MVPCYNEEQNIEDCYGRITEAVIVQVDETYRPSSCMTDRWETVLISKKGRDRVLKNDSMNGLSSLTDRVNLNFQFRF